VNLLETHLTLTRAMRDRPLLPRSFGSLKLPKLDRVTTASFDARFARPALFCRIFLTKALSVGKLCAHPLFGERMSYLNAPRLTFFGQFSACPSTLNNDPCNYDPATKNLTPSWNPKGSHVFTITGCTITGLTMPDGSAGAGDPLLGTPVASIDEPYPAKLVDLDTEQQMVSMIFGMSLQVGSASCGFSGAFAPVCFNDIFGRVVGGSPDSMSALYISRC
jgi:hypothetical protein